MRLVEPDGSVEVTVASDDVIELALEDIPGSGYLWQLEVTGPLSVGDPQYASQESIRNGPVGAGATRLWRIAPTGCGEGTVRGARGQPWEPLERDREFTLQVNVVSAGHQLESGDRPR
jgi:predicted secreted protein